VTDVTAGCGVGETTLPATVGFRVTFYGVRGSTPCSGSELCGYGGNTSCVVAQRDGEDPIIFDMGTGLRFFGQDLIDMEDAFHGSILLTHMHWDHVQGLPFFFPAHVPGSKLDIYGPPDGDRTFGEAFSGLMSPPYFPITTGDLGGEVTFHDVECAEFTLGTAQVMSRHVPHTGITNGYRVDWDGASVAYIPDHQQPDDTKSVHPGVLELCRGADVLIHDAQYTPEEFSQRSDWGHCTIEYAVEVAAQAGVKELVMFHHDPAHDDEWMGKLLAGARASAGAHTDLKVSAAAEGFTMELPG
jgi:phosphoribosyl 1,2-cyclic phosphodiesterase